MKETKGPPRTMSRKPRMRPSIVRFRLVKKSYRRTEQFRVYVSYEQTHRAV